MTARMIAERRAVAPGLRHADELIALARRSARRRMGQWPRRPLSAGERALMWLLRLYVLAMLGVVGLQILRLA